nr:hypothetical protein GCM10017745_35590 [Saccharothrix mutabilis subsp. capreolus]
MYYECANFQIAGDVSGVFHSGYDWDVDCDWHTDPPLVHEQMLVAPVAG